MIRVLAVAVAAALMAPNAVAEGKGNHRPISASRFGMSVDGVDVAKSKARGLKSPDGKKGSGTKGPKLENAWPKKGY